MKYLKRFVFWLTDKIPLPEVIEWPLSEWADPTSKKNKELGIEANGRRTAG